jgi:hypothetical protein
MNGGQKNVSEVGLGDNLSTKKINQVTLGVLAANDY